MAILPVSQLQNQPDIVGNFQRGIQFGTSQRLQRQKEQEQQQLRQLAPSIMQGDPAAFSQAAAINPEAAGQYLDSGDRQYRRLKNVTAMLDNSLKSNNPQAAQAAWSSIRPFLQQLAPQAQVPEQWDESLRPGYEQFKNRIAMAESGSASSAPAGFQQFQMTAEAAGLTPGTPEYQQVARIALGQEGRAATGGYSFDIVEGLDGQRRVQRRNPRTGVVEIYDEQTSEFSPVGSGAPINGAGNIASPMPSMSANPLQDYQAIAQQFPGVQISSTNRTPERNREVGGVPNSQHIAGTAADFVVPEAQKGQFIQQLRARGYEAINEGDHIHAELPPSRRVASNLAVGRSKEQEASAVTSAQEAARLQYLPQELGMRTQASVSEASQKAQEEARIKREADLATAEQKKYVDATTTLGLLDEAEGLIQQSTGSGIGAMADTAAEMFGRSTPGAQAIAALNPVAARLTLAIPRMEGPQSDADRLLYQKAAGDFANPSIPRETRLSALAQMRALANKYVDTGSAPRQPARQSAPNSQARTVVRRGTLNGRPVVQYSDGTTDYAD